MENGPCVSMIYRQISPISPLSSSFWRLADPGRLWARSCPTGETLQTPPSHHRFKAELWHQNTSTIIDDLLFSALVLLAHLRASGNTIIHWICIGLTDSAYSWLLVLISSSSNPMPSLFWLVVLTILKNIKVNRKDDIPYMKWKIKNVPIHQPVLEYLQPFLVGEFPFLSISAR